MADQLTKIVKCAGGEESLGLPPCGHCGEEIIVPLTAAEIAEREQMSKAYLEEQERLKAEAEAQAALKASADAKLAAFYEQAGLTPEEIAVKLA